MKKEINQELMDNELLFYWLTQYIQDTTEKNKVDLQNPAVLIAADNVDDIILDYIKRKKLSIKYMKWPDTVAIFKWKKLILAFESENYLITN